MPCADVRHGLNTIPFGLACQPIWQVVHDDASITPSFVIHSHLLDGIVASVCDLPPFLPASDPRLPKARLGMVLLLHHLESKSFTYRDTQLSRFNDLAAHPSHLTVQFRANGSHTSFAADGRGLRSPPEGILPRLRVRFLGFFCQIPRPPLKPAVGRVYQ